MNTYIRHTSSNVLPVEDLSFFLKSHFTKIKHRKLTVLYFFLIKKANTHQPAFLGVEILLNDIMSHETLTGLSILLSFRCLAWKSETGKNGQEGRSRFLRWVCFSSGWNGPHLPSPGKSSPPKAEVGVSCRVLRITLSPVFQNSASLKSQLKMHLFDRPGRVTGGCSSFRTQEERVIPLSVW